METRICKKCGTPKSLEEYEKTPTGRRWVCRGCRRLYWTTMYHEDEGRRNKVKASARKKAVENGLKYWAYLLEHPCIDCGESDPVTLECDHVRGEKRAAVSYLV